MIRVPLAWQGLPVDAQLEHVEVLGDKRDELASGMEVTAILAQDEEDEEREAEEDNDNSSCKDVEYVDKAQEEALSTTATRQVQLFILQDDISEDELAI